MLSHVLDPPALERIFRPKNSCFKFFAVRPNILIDDLQSLHLTHFESDFRTDLFSRFPLYRAYRFIRDYKPRMAAFTRIPSYLFFYETSTFTSTFTPSVDYIPSHVVEQISAVAVAFPQLVFRSHFSYLIKDEGSFFTDASKTDTFPHLSAACYSSDILIQKKYKFDDCFSTFLAECIAIIGA